MCPLAISHEASTRPSGKYFAKPRPSPQRISKLTCKHLIVSSRILVPLGDVLASPQPKRAVTSSEFWARLSCTAKLYQISE